FQSQILARRASPFVKGVPNTYQGQRKRSVVHAGGAADQGAAGSMPRHRASGEKNNLAGVAHVAREFASIARNRSKPTFEREIGSPGSRRRDAKRSVHI